MQTARGAEVVVQVVSEDGALIAARAGQPGLADLQGAGRFFVKSGLLPKTVSTIEATLTIMVTGYELGIGPMQALRLISVVNGKPVCAAELMAALIDRDHGDGILAYPSDKLHQSPLA
jgi:hypothetical protein